MRRSDSARLHSGPAGDGGDAKAVEAAAVRLLARREHSTQELQRKLVSKGHPAAVVAEVVARLSAKRLVSDERFVASFVHHHAQRGQGPVRIRIELRRQGIDSAQIEQALDRVEMDWSHLAARVRQRRFGTARPGSPGERAKQARFLQYRGFDAEQIRAAFAMETPAGDDLASDPGDAGDLRMELDPDEDGLPTENSGI